MSLDSISGNTPLQTSSDSDSEEDDFFFRHHFYTFLLCSCHCRCHFQSETRFARDHHLTIEIKKKNQVIQKHQSKTSLLIVREKLYNSNSLIRFAAQAASFKT